MQRMITFLLATTMAAHAVGLGGTLSGNVTQSDNNAAYRVEMGFYGSNGSISLIANFVASYSLLAVPSALKTSSSWRALSFPRQEAMTLPSLRRSKRVGVPCTLMLFCSAEATASI